MSRKLAGRFFVFFLHVVSEYLFEYNSPSSLLFFYSNLFISTFTIFIKCKFIASSNNRALLCRVFCFHLVLLRRETLANSSALILSRLEIFLASFSSQMQFKQVAINHTAGSSHDSGVWKLSKMTSLAVKLPAWLDRQASKGVATCVLYGQVKRWSWVSSGVSQKLQEGDGDFPWMKRSKFKACFYSRSITLTFLMINLLLLVQSFIYIFNNFLVMLTLSNNFFIFLHIWHFCSRFVLTNIC